MRTFSMRTPSLIWAAFSPPVTDMYTGALRRLLSGIGNSWVGTRLLETLGDGLCHAFEFRSVRTRGPVSVTATVCSAWAAREPSFVHRVQPSGAAW
ncbi:hypothetical protein EDD90_1772 [Streptomyces sp. Ag109_O5-1]|nr:hypothetical protein EDD90_1772 [Streptomyces sp. Ag109_O5-1]